MTPVPVSSRRWLRRLGLGLGVACALVAAVVATGLVLANEKAQRRLSVSVAAIQLPSGAEALARGRYLYESRGCADCHGEDGGGRKFADSGAVQLAGPDITRAGRAAGYRAQDWVRAVRHGIAPDGRPLRIMPSEDYARLTDADLGALVAHVQALPPGPGRAAVLQLPLPARLLYGYGLLDDAADRIDHSRPPETPVPEAATVAHGRYVAQMCVACHGPGFAGGRIPNAPPDWPAAANLTPGEGGVMARYGNAQAFAQMMRNGRRPDGSRIAVMPFEALSKMNDTDLEAMHLFLATLPPRAAGTR
jgi:mono/diheme cytochrome c family protein